MSDRAVDLAGAWSGVIVLVGVTLGLLVLGGFFPPQHPANSAQEIADWYVADVDKIRAGTVLMMLSFALVGVYIAAITNRLRRVDNPNRFLTYVQVIMNGASVVLAILVALPWALASFRPGEISPEITQVLNDAGWFFFLWTLSAFVVLLIAMAIGMLAPSKEGGGSPPFPRWAGYVTVWCALLLMPGSMIVFFHDGPLAYNGVLGLYVPVTGFFVWFIAITVLLFKKNPAGAEEAA